MRQPLAKKLGIGQRPANAALGRDHRLLADFQGQSIIGLADRELVGLVLSDERRDKEPLPHRMAGCPVRRLVRRHHIGVLVAKRVLDFVDDALQVPVRVFAIVDREGIEDEAQDPGETQQPDAVRLRAAMLDQLVFHPWPEGRSIARAVVLAMECEQTKPVQCQQPQTGAGVLQPVDIEQKREHPIPEPVRERHQPHVHHVPLIEAPGCGQITRLHAAQAD